MNERLRRREPAVRAFFFELRETNEQIPGEDRSPRYVLLPSGAYANRALLIGILSGTETRENGIKAYMSDPTSDISFFSGRYTPEVTSFLSEAETPCICALVAKLGTFETQDGARFISLKPESMGKTDERSREYWILTTAKETLSRLEHLRDAKEGRDATQAAKDAVEHYNTNIERYYNMVFNALRSILPQKSEGVDNAAAIMAGRETENAKTENLERVKREILQIVEENREGITYDELVRALGEYDENAVEEALNALMNSGALFEPQLGRFKIMEG